MPPLSSSQQRCWQKKIEKKVTHFLFLFKKKKKKTRSCINMPKAIPGTMRRLRAIVPPFGVEDDVRWVEEDVPEEGERGNGGDKTAANADGGGDASTLTSSTSTLEPEVLVPGVRRCLPPAPPPGSKPSILAILK